MFVNSCALASVEPRFDRWNHAAWIEAGQHHTVYWRRLC